MARTETATVRAMRRTARVHEGVGAVDDAGLAFDELADGSDLGGGELVVERGEGGC